jgi:hypothetical protein
MQTASFMVVATLLRHCTASHSTRPWSVKSLFQTDSSICLYIITALLSFFFFSCLYPSFPSLSTPSLASFISFLRLRVLPFLLLLHSILSLYLFYIIQQSVKQCKVWEKARVKKRVTSNKIYESHDLKVKQYDKHVNLLLAHNEVASDSVGHQSTPSHFHKIAIHS